MMFHDPFRMARVLNGRETVATPRLSILVPTFRDDPSPLIRALAPAAARLGTAVELIVYDDGSRDATLVCRISDALQAFGAPARLIVAEDNGGRSTGRNRLVADARGAHCLFLDADMLPASSDFLDRWLALATPQTAVACGGFLVSTDAVDQTLRLHQYLARRSDCRSATERARKPAHTTVTSNLLVRRDVVAAFPFDATFSGWGWEDVDWAFGVAAHHDIRHVDNPALHAGLDTTDVLLRKYAHSAANFERLSRRHPDVVRELTGWRLARWLSYAPGHARTRPLLNAIARASALPLFVRHVAIKLFRTSIYAETFA